MNSGFGAKAPSRNDEEGFPWLLRLQQNVLLLAERQLDDAVGREISCCQNVFFFNNYLVVDFNPDTISSLNKVGIPSLYGDVDDVDLLGELPLDKIQIAISTVPECETNTVLINAIRRVNKKAIIIVRAHTIDDALELYKKGANYVLTPHFLGGEYVSKMITDLKVDEKGYEKEKEKHIQMLKDVAKKGEEHPRVERN